MAQIGVFGKLCFGKFWRVNWHFGMCIFEILWNNSADIWSFFTWGISGIKEIYYFGFNDKSFWKRFHFGLGSIDGVKSRGGKGFGLIIHVSLEKETRERSWEESRERRGDRGHRRRSWASRANRSSVAGRLWRRGVPLVVSFVLFSCSWSSLAGHDEMLMTDRSCGEANQRRVEWTGVAGVSTDRWWRELLKEFG